MQRFQHARPAARPEPDSPAGALARSEASRALALVANEGRRGKRVVACCPEAARLGVRPGMPAAEAASLGRRGKFGRGRRSDAPTLRIEPEDRPADEEALRRLARWCLRFTPTVSVEETERPECLFLDITGCAPLFGGEEGLARKLTDDLSRQGWLSRVAIADTVGTAWGVARHGEAHRTVPVDSTIVPPGRTREALAPLSIAALRLPAQAEAILWELGITRIEQLARLPAASLSSRLGPEVLTRLAQATGELAEIVVPCRSVPNFEAAVPLEPPVAEAAVIERLLGQLLEQVTTQLGPDLGIEELSVWLRHESGRRRELVLCLSRPSAHLPHLVELTRLRLERTSLAEPVSGVMVRVTGYGRLECRQRELFELGPDGERERELMALVDRLANRLGREAVSRARPVADPAPERAYRHEPAVDTIKPRPAARSRSQRLQPDPTSQEPVGQAGPFFRRPIRLFQRPAPLTVLAAFPEGPPRELRWGSSIERVARAWGPERIETGWWRGAAMGRDYYRARTESGRRLWIFRDRVSRRWYLHGIF